MRIVPTTQRELAALRVVQAQAEACQSCHSECAGVRYVWDDSVRSSVLQTCPRATASARRRSVAHLIEASGVPAGTQPISVPELYGLTVIAPPWKTETLRHELHLRRVCAGVVSGWIIDHQQPAYYLPYHAVYTRRAIDPEVWATMPLIAFVGWHFRGLPERHAALLNDVLLSRLDIELPTVVCCSADTSLLSPRWTTDRPIVDALKHPNRIIRVHP